MTRRGNLKSKILVVALVATAGTGMMLMSDSEAEAQEPRQSGVFISESTLVSLIDRVSAIFGQQKAQQKSVGAFPGPDVQSAMTFNSGVTYSSADATSTSATSYTLTANDITNIDNALYDTVEMDPTGGNLTLTFPASSTLSHVLTDKGSRAEQCWYNANGSNTLSFSTATGIDFETSSSTQSTLESEGYACLTFIREQDRDIGVLMTEYDN